MSKDSLRIPDYLAHALQAIQRIRRYTEHMSEAAFLESELTQDAVVRNIEIIGEAANNIRQADPHFIEQHPEVPWKIMRAMRNRISHGYFEIDWGIVWQTAQHDLPLLEKQLHTLLGAQQ